MLAKLLEGGLLVLEAQGSRLEQVSGHVIPKNLEGALDASTGGDGSSGGAAQVRVVEVGQSIGTASSLATFAALLPGFKGLRCPHCGNQGANCVRIADGHAISTAYFLRASSCPELARAADHRKGNLWTRARDFEGRGASGFHEGAASKECTTPDG